MEERKICEKLKILPSEVKLVSVHVFVVFPLIIDVFLDHFKIDSDSGDKVSPGPETLLGKHFLVSESVVNFYG